MLKRIVDQFEIIRKRRELKDVYKRVFQNEDGRYLFRHWMREAYVTEPTYVVGDPHETAHREGMRRFVLSVIRKANYDDEQLLRMIEEEYENAG